MTETFATAKAIVMESTNSIKENDSEKEQGFWEIVTGRNWLSEVVRGPQKQEPPIFNYFYFSPQF